MGDATTKRESAMGVKVVPDLATAQPISKSSDARKLSRHPAGHSKMLPAVASR